MGMTSQPKQLNSEEGGFNSIKMSETRNKVHKCLIVAGGFITLFVTGGSTYAYSVIYTQALERFGLSGYMTAWISALIFAAPQLLSPVLSSLILPLGPSTLVTLASLAIFCLFVATAFATAIWQVYLSVIILGGFGIGSAFLSALYCVSHSFQERRGMALGFCLTGSGLGGFIASVLTTYLFAEFDWLWACLVLGACSLNVAVAGRLFALPINVDHPNSATPPDHTKQTQNKPNGSRMVWTVEEDSAAHISEPEVTTDKLQGSFHSQPVLQTSVSWSSKSDVNLLVIEKYNHTPKCIEGLRSAFAKWSESAKPKFRLFTSEFTKSLKQIVSKEVYTTNLNFLLLCILTFTAGLCISNSITYIYHHVEVSLMKSCGSSQTGDCDIIWAAEKATLVVSTLSVSSSIGVLLFGVLSDRLNVIVMMMSIMITMALSMMAIGLVNLNAQSFPFYTAIVAVNGLSQGASNSVSSLLLSKMNGLQLLSASLSVGMVFRGLASLIGTPIGGLMYDIYQSYKPGFTFVGVMTMASVLQTVILHVLLRFVVRVKYNMTLSFPRSAPPQAQDVGKAPEANASVLAVSAQPRTDTYF